MQQEIYVSATNAEMEMAGVFEYDGETGYFYLCKVLNEKCEILDKIHIFSGAADFSEVEVNVKWFNDEKQVALCIRDVVWAIFDIRNKSKSSGDYKSRSPLVLNKRY